LATNRNVGDINYWKGSAWITLTSTPNEGATLQMISSLPTWTRGTPPVPISSKTIGTQVWNSKNLSTDKFNDGTPIALNATLTDWVNLTTPAYTWMYGDSSTYHPHYRRLCNWEAVISRKLCPVGSHVPTEADWDILFAAVGGTTDPLQSTGTTLWSPPNTHSTNSFLSSANPGDQLSTHGLAHWKLPNYNGYLCSSTAYNATQGRTVVMFHNGDTYYYYYYYYENVLKKSDSSVRYLQD
jgi:uncharacterized protein (TIGR02145 family)